MDTQERNEIIDGRTIARLGAEVDRLRAALAARDEALRRVVEALKAFVKWGDPPGRLCWCEDGPTRGHGGPHPYGPLHDNECNAAWEALAFAKGVRRK